MSWGTCTAGSNNIHFDFPPIMSDGRNFARWQPGAVINQEIRKENNIKTNSQYRQFLTENADSIVKANQLEACDNCCYCPAMRTGEPISNEDSDLKNLYLSSFQLQCRMVAPIITQDQFLKQKIPNPN